MFILSKFTPYLIICAISFLLGMVPGYWMGSKLGYQKGWKDCKIKYEIDTPFWENKE